MTNIYLLPAKNLLAAPGDIEWGHFFGGALKEEAYSVQQTTDGGFIIVGVTYSYGLGNADVYLVKTDKNGNEVWSNTFGGPFAEFGYSVQQTKDGGFIITGHTHPYGTGNIDVYLIKTDAYGNEVWTNTLGGLQWDYSYSVQQTTDGGFIIAGKTMSYGAGNFDVYLLKTDANGNEVWSKTFGGSSSDAGSSVLQTADGGFIITGYTSSYGGRSGGAYLLKTDANGNKVWGKTYGGSLGTSGYSVRQTTDGGFMVAGGILNANTTSIDVLLLKTDSKGNEVWRQTYGGASDEYAYSISQTTDGGFIITGGTRSYGAGAEDAFVLKTDATGNIVWVQTYGLSSFETGYSVIQTTDGAFVITGETFSYGSNYQIFLLKVKP